jgi:membrane protein YdbS with pleckstrin-like domain
MPSEAIDPAGISWIRVSPKYVTVRLVGWAIFTVVAVALLSAPLVLTLTGLWPGFPAWLGWLLSLGTLALCAWAGLLIPRQVRAIGYAERDEDLLIRRGLFFQRVMVVPYGRMQYVDVGVGPLERAFGLCSVKLHTASPQTNAGIPGVPAAEGARLREQLSDRGQARLAGL